jgi:hypothetical protein
MIVVVSLPLTLFGIVCLFLPFGSVNELIISFLSIIALSVALCLYLIFQFGKELN